MARPYHVVVWGATGFTGRLVCEHLARDYHGKVRWAVAGRNQQKLDELRQHLASINDSCKAIPVVIANSADKSSIDAMVKQASVVVATAGPFSKYSRSVVEASAVHGTHYCDITGELGFVRDSYLQNNAQAKETGAKIVHCCGYDSIPTDLGALLVVDHMDRKLGRKCARVDNLVRAVGAASGGTLETGMTMPASEVAAIAGDKYYLVADPNKKGSDKPRSPLPFWVPAAASFSCWWIMEGCNTRVAHMSNALSRRPYGTDWRIDEGIKGGGLLSSIAASLVMVVVLIAFGTPLKYLVRRFLPKPGEGPSLKVQRSGWWDHVVVGLTEEEPGKQQQTVVARAAHFNADPGYWSTSRMVLEAGLCLALQGDELAAAGLPQGGVLTPASAMGMVLVERLRRAGFVFDIIQSPAGVDAGATVSAQAATAIAAK